MAGQKAAKTAMFEEMKLVAVVFTSRCPFREGYPGPCGKAQGAASGIPRSEIVGYEQRSSVLKDTQCLA